MKFKDNLFAFSLITIILFFLTGVLPALKFDDNVRLIVDKVNTSEDLSFEALNQKFKSVENLTVHQVNEKIVFEFKRPNYIFLYVNAESEKEFNNKLPTQISLKFV